MAVSGTMYGLGMKHLVSDVNYISDTIKVALCTNSYTPNQNTHEFFSDVTNELSTANGYTAGGATLGTKTLTYDTGTKQVRLGAANTAWTATTGNTIGPARRAVIYKSTGTASTSPLLGWVDFGQDVSATGADFTVTWDSTGALRVSVS